MEQQEKRKVLLASTLRDLLKPQGWYLYLSFNNEFLFKNNKDEILAVPQHPTKPHLVYLDELLKRSPVLRQEFIDAARPEWDIADEPLSLTHLHFDLFIDPGDAGIAEVQAVLTALSELNRSAGGFGSKWEV